MHPLVLFSFRASISFHSASLYPRMHPLLLVSPVCSYAYNWFLFPRSSRFVLESVRHVCNFKMVRFCLRILTPPRVCLLLCVISDVSLSPFLDLADFFGASPESRSPSAWSLPAWSTSPSPIVSRSPFPNWNPLIACSALISSYPPSFSICDLPQSRHSHVGPLTSLPE